MKRPILARCRMLRIAEAFSVAPVLFAVAAVSCAFAAAACTPVDVLREPTHSESSSALEAGIQVTVTVWPTTGASSETFPVELLIENRSAQAIVVDYDHIALSAPGADEPHIEPLPTLSEDERTVYRSGPGTAEAWPGPFSDDAVAEVDPDIPTAPLRWERVPLAETTLGPGEAVKGFVFFPLIDRRALPLDLLFDVVAHDGGRRDAVIAVRLPLLP